MILPRSESIIVEWTFLAGSVLTLLALAIVGWSKQRVRGSRVAWLLVIALAWVSAFVFVRSHTGLGVLVLGGANQWVAKAAAAPDEQAAHILSEVIRSSNYGVDAAERAVLQRPIKFERIRLFILLATVAPNESWRQRYLSHAQIADNTPQASHPRPNSR